MATRRNGSAPHHDVDQNLIPNVGQILRRFRKQHKLSIRQVAERSELSQSFLHAVEHGESDISLGRLVRLARVFGYDIGSFLGFTTRLSKPNFIGRHDRSLVDRGKGVRYESLRLPGIEFELETVEFAPRSAFRNELSHEGIDVIYCTRGELVLVFNGTDYAMGAGDCCVFSAAYPHKIRNDSKETSALIGFTSGRMA
jgi:transcriptional regulator with XRE-family HTH domain